MTMETLSQADLAPAIKEGIINVYQANPAQFEKALEELVGQWQTTFGLQNWATLEKTAKGRGFSSTELLRLGLLMGQVAYLYPENLRAVYNQLSLAWNTHQPTQLPATAQPNGIATRQLPRMLKQVFSDQLNLQEGNLEDAGRNIRLLIEALSPELNQAWSEIILGREGQAAAIKEGYLRQPYQLEELRDYPATTLGHAFYRMLVNNGYSVEIISPSTQWASTQTVLGYVYRRIYEGHDIRHVVTGFNTSLLGEYALQGYELAQFFHPYTASILATISLKMLFSQPAFFPSMLDAMLAGWQLGLQIPSTLGMQWEQMWGQPLSEIRRQVPAALVTY